VRPRDALTWCKASSAFPCPRRRRVGQIQMAGREPHRTLAPVTSAISVSGLVKTFGSTRALDGLDLLVRAGEVHGFLGPNGSGKSTTIRVLLGLLRADAGQLRLLNGDPWRDAVALHRRLAYVPGDVTLWPNLTGGEVIDLLGRLRSGIDPRRRADLIARFDLDPTKKGRAYSKGNRVKVALVAALASDVELLLLDHQFGLQRLANHLPQRHLRHRPDRPHRSSRRRDRHRRRQLPAPRCGDRQEVTPRQEASGLIAQAPAPEQIYAHRRVQLVSPGAEFRAS
jgi:ABC-type transport system involved in cytochrome c biogenesis ATPase subunit